MITFFQKHSQIFKHTNHFTKIFKHFYEPFIFSHQRNVICTVHTTSCYELNKRTPTLITDFIKSFSFTHTIATTPPQISVYQLQIHITIFLHFTYCMKNTNLQGILHNYDPITQMYIFCPLTKTFNDEEARPLIVPHEYIQPIEVPILEFIHNTKYNHKIYNLIQNTPHEFAVGTEELKTIKALQLLWPLMKTKNIIRILAKLLTTSDADHDVFSHGFFPED